MELKYKVLNQVKTVGEMLKNKKQWKKIKYMWNYKLGNKIK